ncbi:dephospho-CoA kinase [Aliiglaciecola sp. CAU 1673]|uniref:dephospho-CoA kinase n=1 Tax=Aliiglaciecola sp. CAU 1673 TaxID=3032595 RepID=UPI0023D98118|nr:dephospho-CoA kinase [Aliiglaciecola sp. CAU 1673]MDF2178420.1 dephospho-CoA kinase [Aliiglaciecola sp. CAU 1673]
MSQLVIGLTGGIGSGKSTVSALFEKHGIEVIDADIIAREVVAPGTPALQQISEKFGTGILDNKGALNRQALREQVFNHPEDKAWLNSLLHPVIRQTLLERAKKATSPYCILAIPLLVENGLTTLVDRVLVVDLDEDEQLLRASMRDGSNEQLIRNIMASQASRRQRLAVADEIIDNSAGPEALPAQVAQLHQAYLQLAATR